MRGSQHLWLLAKSLEALEGLPAVIRPSVLATGRGRRKALDFLAFRASKDAGYALCP